MLDSTTYSECRALDASFDDALTSTRAALAEEGFGVVSEIDVQATLRAKLGVEREPYTILGACNPQLAHQALTVEPQLGALLPCNVTVFVLDGQTYVSSVSAEQMLGMVGNPSLAPVAREVGARLERVLGHIAGEPSAIHPTEPPRPPAARRAPAEARQ